MTYASHILIVKSHKSEFRISKSSAVLRTPYGGHLTVETISKPVLSKKACPERKKPALSVADGSNGPKDSNDQRPKTKDQIFSGPETCFEFWISIIRICPFSVVLLRRMNFEFRASYFEFSGFAGYSSSFSSGGWPLFCVSDFVLLISSFPALPAIVPLLLRAVDLCFEFRISCFLFRVFRLRRL